MSTVLQQPPSGGAPQSSLLPHLHPHGLHGHHLHHRPAAEIQAAAHNPDVLLALLARNKALEGKRTDYPNLNVSAPDRSAYTRGNGRVCPSRTGSVRVNGPTSSGCTFRAVTNENVVKRNNRSE